jgi:hypothetical protein
MTAIFLYLKEILHLINVLCKSKMDRNTQKIREELNYLKREKEVMEQQFARRREDILQKIRSSEQNFRESPLMCQISQLNSEYAKQTELYNQRIRELQQTLNSQQK